MPPDQAARPVLAEPHDLSKPWDEIVKFTTESDDKGMPMESFYNSALFMASTWKNQHTVQMEKFKKALSPEKCVGHALEQLGMTDALWPERLRKSREKVAA